MSIDTDRLRRLGMLTGWRFIGARWLIRDELVLAAKEIDRLRADLLQGKNAVGELLRLPVAEHSRRCPEGHCAACAVQEWLGWKNAKVNA